MSNNYSLLNVWCMHIVPLKFWWSICTPIWSHCLSAMHSLYRIICSMILSSIQIKYINLMYLIHMHAWFVLVAIWMSSIHPSIYLSIYIYIYIIHLHARMVCLCSHRNVIHLDNCIYCGVNACMVCLHSLAMSSI